MTENEQTDAQKPLSFYVIWVVGFLAWGLHLFGVLFCMSMTDTTGMMNFNVQFPIGAVLVTITSITMWFTRSKQASFTTLLYCFAIAIYAGYIVIVYPEQPDGRADVFGPPLWCFFVVMASLVVIISGVPGKLFGFRKSKSEEE